MKLFGREPAAWAALAAVVIKLVAAFWIHLSADQQSALNAVVAGVLGLIVAFVVRDGIQAAVLGFAQAALALGIGFGLHVAADNQAVIMSFVAVAVGMFVRTQATAPVPAQDTAVPIN
jgi:FtsH-binding integral membrane protein